MRRALTVLAAAVLIVAGTTTSGPVAQGSTPELLVGGPVTWLGSIGEPGMVSGRIVEGTSDLGDPTRFLVTHGPRGISVYDVRIPERPLLAGHLPLPHFYTEDMDLGGDTLIVAVDPSWADLVTSGGTIGGLYLVDISELPRLGLHYVDPLNANLWKEPSRVSDGGGHTITCIRADCTWAYVNGTHTVAVLDLTDPSAPEVAGTFPSPVGDTHDIQVDGQGHAWLVGGSGIVALDTTNPTSPVQVTNRHSGGLGYHHNSLRPDDGSTVLVTEEAVYPVLDHAACGPSRGSPGQGRFQTRTITGGDGVVGTGSKESLTVADTWATELQVAGVAGRAVVWCSAHYFDESDGLVSIAWYEQGTRLLDVSDPADIRQVGYFIPPDGEVWDAQFVGPGALGGEIVYTFDFVRGIDILRVDRDGGPLPTLTAPVLDQWWEPVEGPAPAQATAAAAGPYGVLCQVPPGPGAARATSALTLQ